MKIFSLIKKKGYILFKDTLYIKSVNKRTQYIELYVDRIRCYCYTNGELEYDYSLDVTDKNHLELLEKQN